MAKEDRHRSRKSRGENAIALDRWEGEGGAAAPAWPLLRQLSGLKAGERRILECLGAALVSVWTDLPTDIQRELFRQVTTSIQDSGLLRKQIARFLHDHKDDS
jgi:hypothetical protein